MDGSGWSIGREDAKKCDILLEGNTISGVHASLNYLNGKFYLIDNKSKNGSYLIRERNKIYLTDYTEVFPTDIIVFGASEVSFSDLLSEASKVKGLNISSLTIVNSKNNISAQLTPSLEKIGKYSKPSGKKIRCMVCMEPITLNKICPSCGSSKHLKGNQ